jgi:hypothetical protein
MNLVLVVRCGLPCPVVWAEASVVAPPAMERSSSATASRRRREVVVMTDAARCMEWWLRYL